MHYIPKGGPVCVSIVITGNDNIFLTQLKLLCHFKRKNIPPNWKVKKCSPHARVHITPLQRSWNISSHCLNTSFPCLNTSIYCQNTSFPRVFPGKASLPFALSVLWPHREGLLHSCGWWAPLGVTLGRRAGPRTPRHTEHSASGSGSASAHAETIHNSISPLYHNIKESHPKQNSTKLCHSYFCPNQPDYYVTIRLIACFIIFSGACSSMCVIMCAVISLMAPKLPN